MGAQVHLNEKAAVLRRTGSGLLYYGYAIYRPWGNLSFGMAPILAFPYGPVSCRSQVLASPTSLVGPPHPRLVREMRPLYSRRERAEWVLNTHICRQT